MDPNASRYFVVIANHLGEDGAEIPGMTIHVIDSEQELTPEQRHKIAVDSAIERMKGKPLYQDNVFFEGPEGQCIGLHATLFNLDDSADRGHYEIVPDISSRATID